MTPMANKLTVTTPSDREIVMTRVFAAPRALVYECHTKPELVRRWLLGPPGWSMPVCEIDLRVGGKYRYRWRSEESGHEFGVAGVYREIKAPERIVHTELFDGAEMGGESLVTAVFAENAGKTTLTTTMLMQSRQARDEAIKSGMEGGVAQSYDRLEEVMATLPAGRGS
jgi:uncharacterized protein YndB with AHSA1/START domain